MMTTGQRNIFFTAATSKIGINLVVSFLKETNHRLWVMVRKHPHARDPWKRIEQALMLQNEPISLEHYRDRLIIFSGDLTKRGLGISDPVFEMLDAAGIDEFFHTASHTSRRDFSKETLFNANVEGTLRSLKLAQRLRAKTFNHLGWLYSSQSNSSRLTNEINYLDFLDETENVNNLYEFVHQMTLSNVVRLSKSYGMNFRAVCPGYLFDLENHNGIQNRWFYIVFRLIFDMSTAARRVRGSKNASIYFPADDVPIFLTTPLYVAKMMKALFDEGEATANQIFDLFNASLSVHSLINSIHVEFPEVKVRLTTRNQRLPHFERQFLNRALVFFEYLLKRKDFKPSSTVLNLEDVYKIQRPEFTKEAIQGIARACHSIYEQDPYHMKPGPFEVSVLKTFDFIDRFRGRVAS